ncbi:RNA polymerase sigma factor [Pontibacter toksunensis]|uniref:RNA polymerase sigma factor n=1 Tax=Pontibacter toksunensis TaxID=1332631 RepID=A0ABW6BXV3_9BACT
MSGINLQGETEQSLVAALQQGRQEVLGLLYDAYAPVMMGVISSIVPDQEMAEQVLQETFVAIWTRIEVYDATRNRFLTWGLAIARGIALEAVKNGRYTAVAQQQKSRNFAGAENKENSFLKKGKQENEQLCHLEPQEKEILELVYLKGRSCTEAAAELGITEEKMRVVLKNAFVHLKAKKPA